MNARERFEQTLAGFMYRKRTFLTGNAAVWTALACTVLALALILIDIRFELAVFWRWLALGSLVGTAVALLGSLWLGRVLRYRRQGAIRELETVRTDLGQLLRTSDELGDERRARELGFSPALAEELARQAGEEIERTPTEMLLPWRTVRRVAAVFLVLLLAGIIMAIVWPDFRTATARIALPQAAVSYTVLEVSPSAAEFEREQTVTITAKVNGRPVEGAEVQLRPTGQPEAEWRPLPMEAETADTFRADVAGWLESFDFRVAAGRARTPAQTVRFLDPPRVEEYTVTLTFPDYTGLPSREVPLQRVAGVVGTKARFHFRLNHALASGSIRGPDDYSWDVPPNAEEFDWEVDLAEGSARYSMVGEDVEGLALKPAEWQTRGMPDRPPEIAIQTPAEDLRVTKLTEIPLDIRVSDDFGIAEAGIVLTIDGREHRLVQRTYKDDAPRRVRLEYGLELERFGVEANANVRLHAYAADRLPSREGNSVSGLRIIDIRPLKILYRLPDPDEPPMTSEEQQQLEEQMAKLDDAIEAQQELLAKTLREREEHPKDTEPREELAKQQESIAEQLQTLREQAQQQEATPEENDQHLAAALEHMQEAAKELRAPDPREALQKEDEALAEMLRARNQLEQELKQKQQQQQQKQEQQRQPEPPKPLDDLAQRAEELAKQEEALAEKVQEQQPQAQAESDPAKQQEQAVAEANQLLEDIQEHPETTALAEQRMAEARDEMKEAAESLAQNEPEKAKETMQEARQDLERLAEHLRGLDQKNALETMEKAREKAERAAERLEQLAQQPNQEQQAQNEQQQQQDAQQQAQADARNQAQQQAEKREQIAREAETLADWMKRIAETKTEDRERVAKQMDEARKELAADELAQDIREATKDREEGREQQAEQQDRETAERLREMAKTFEKEREEMVRNQLERLAQAEARTKQLAEEVQREAKEPSPPRPDKPTTSEKLDELAQDYQELGDRKMEDIGKELQEQVSQQNQIGGPKQGAEIPEDVTDKSLDPGARRLRQLIDEIVEREMLIDRDRRVPEQYQPLVDTYFKELSDDARE